MNNFFRTTILISLLALILSGCINLRVKNPEQRQYAFTVTCPSKVENKKSTKTQHILEVSTPQITSMFDSSKFVYRYSNINYTSDYYNTFFDSPSLQLHQNLINCLQMSKLFSYVAANTYPKKSDYILKSYVKELYADYENSKLPRAVLSITFVLFDNTDKHNILLNKTFREVIPLKQKTSDALMYAWNMALQNILDQMITDLNKKI